MDLAPPGVIDRMARARAEIVPPLALAIAYFVLGAMFIVLSRDPGSVATIWFGDAVAVGVIVRRPGRLPALLVAVLAGGLAAYLVTGAPVQVALGLMAAHVAEIFVAYGLIRVWHGDSRDFDGELGSYLRLVAAAAFIGPAISGVLSALLLNVLFGTPFVQTWIQWLGAGAVGGTTALLLVLLLTSERIRAAREATRWRQVAVLLVAVVASAAWPLFVPNRPVVLVLLPTFLAALWVHPLVVSLTTVVALTAATTTGFLAGTDADIGGLTAIAAAVFIAPISISLVLQSLRKERSRLREILDRAGVGKAEMSVDGDWRDANQSMLDLLGYRADEVDGLTWEGVTHPDDRKTMVVQRRRLLAGIENPVRAQVRCLRKDGSIVWGDVLASVVRDEVTGEPRRIILQIVDISAHHDAEQALADSKERLAIAIEAANLGIWDFDLERGARYYSPAWKAMFGIEGELSLDTDPDAFLDMVHPDDLERVKAESEALRSGRLGRFSIEYRIRHADGGWLWVHNMAKPVRWFPDGKPLRIVGVCRNITAEREAQMALEESERRWAFALDSARQGVWEYSFAERRRYHSDTWAEMLGYRPDEISQYDEAWRDLVHPDDLPVIDRTIATTADTGSEFELEFRLRHKDGHWVWVLDRGKIIERDATGAPLRMIGTHTDITERRMAEERMRRLSQRVHLATRASGVGLWEVDIRNRSVWWDERLREMYGVEPHEEVVYGQWAGMVHPEDRPRVERELEDAVIGVRSFDTAFRIVQPDGEVRHVRSIAETMRDRDDEVIRLVGSNWDVSEFHELNAALSREKERLRVTLESIGEGVISTDTEGRVAFMNKVAELETGWPEHEAIGRPLDEVFPLTDEWTKRPVESPVPVCLETRRQPGAQDEVVLVNRAGRHMDVRNTASPILTEDGDLVGVVLVFQDVTRARRLQRELGHAATHDSLTELRNRAAFERDLESFVSETAGADTVHSLCYIDLDRFKQVNDGAGHAAGDAALRSISQAVRAEVRAVDVVARIGGDEFALLLRDCEPEDAVRVCEKIRDAIDAVEVSFDGHDFHVGASFGIAAITGEDSPDDVLNAADSACYDAKAAGRNAICVYRAPADGRATGACA